MNTRTIIASERIEIEGIVFTFNRKYVRRLALRIKRPGVPVVTYPAHTPLAEAVAFARANIGWVRKQLSRLAALPEPRRELFSREDTDCFTERLKDVFARAEERMGLYASHVTVKVMRTRWGSCQPRTARISISLLLADKPAECLEYVVIHELAHLRHADHSPAFWALVERYCPDWRRLRARLREP